jgi:DNA-binding NarL/FixJ family response regulator
VTTPLVSRVLLADDHALVRLGIRQTLDSQPDFEVVAEVEDGREAVDRALAGDIDLAVLDISMPRLTGLQAAREITSRSDAVRVLILSVHDDEQYFFEALRAGAGGYILKSAAAADLIAAGRATMRGEPFLVPSAVRALVRDYLNRAEAGTEPSEDPLTPRESEIVKLVAEGHSTREIGELLFISEKTVERHRGRVLEKLGMRDRVDLTRWAIRRGLIEP